MTIPRPLAALCEGAAVSDEEFDRLLPTWARNVSGQHFTPVRVARRAAELLVAREGARVLDVGAGVGKLCVVGALTTAGRFVGVEQREHLVRAGRALMQKGQVPRCELLHANMTEIDWRGFDAFYLYNPFAEHLREIDAIDETIALSASARRRYLDFVAARLDESGPGARVVTYHGFGGEMPAGWLRRSSERCGTGPLELWVKDLYTESR